MKILNKIFFTIKQNKSIFLSIVLHLSIIFLFIIAKSINESETKLTIEINNQNNIKEQIINAKSISNNDLQNQINQYEEYQKELERIKIEKLQKIKNAENNIKKAINQAKKDAIRKARQKALEKQKRIAEEKAKKKAKLLAKKKAYEERQKKIAEEKLKKIKEQKAKEKAEKERLEAIRKAKEQARLLAEKKAYEEKQRKLEQSKAQKAIGTFIRKYQQKVGDNWIKDSCRGIYNLPSAIILNGKFVKLIGTSGSQQCDNSLINAIKNTQAPIITNTIAKNTIEKEKIEFKFNL